MRVIVFLVYLCFHLLGGSSVHANTPENIIYDSLISNLSENQKVKITIADHASVVIEYADLDLDEEHLSCDEIQDGHSNNFFAEKYSLLDSWYLPISQRFISNYYYTLFKIFLPFCGNSSPIYITNRVLRI
ncbi:hypothetical protein [Flavobacterium lacustre]|uniref:hypothetical protein n=1 Tax=Flavobacterium lacustre TaxID=3016339 RepID=UPI0022B61C2E|nr:hypothetical protein [Flavobacterium lacustre]